MRWVFFLGILLFACRPQAQPFGEVDALMGIYEGSWSTPTAQGKVEGQIRKFKEHYDGFLAFLVNDKTQAIVRVTSEPFTNGMERLAFRAAPMTNLNQAGNFQLTGHFVGLTNTTPNITALLTGSSGEGTVQAKKTTRKPPTLGAKPPEKAIVLFDGKSTNHWKSFHWLNLDDGSMQVQKGNLQTDVKLPSFQLHLEFRTPMMPDALGQARGNSGVYLQSIYEVQVLDSFGLWPLQINDCSSIYGVKTASANASLPPGEWQTYDITFQAGKSKDQAPEITVVHNGVTVVDKAKVPQDKVGKGGGGGNPKGGFLMLQDHGNPVQFRNIWAVPLE
jgi:hypothetical protein